jgi:hypothetical protein
MIASHWRVKYYSEPFNPENPGCPAGHYFHYMTRADEPRFIAYLKPLLQLDSGVPGNNSAGHQYLRFLEKAGKSAWHLLGRCLGVRPLLKDPMALFSAEWLERRFQTSTIVLIRHPAAFASSLKRLNWHFPFGDFLDQPRLMDDFLEPFRSTIEEFAKKPPDIVAQSILLWRILHARILRYRLKHPEWTFARHEDLSTSPHEEFSKLFRTLGLNDSAGVHQTIAEYSAPENPVEADDGAVHQLKRNSLGNIWNWTQRLSRDEILRVREGTEDIAHHFYSAADWSQPASATRQTSITPTNLVLDVVRAAS